MARTREAFLHNVVEMSLEDLSAQIDVLGESAGECEGRSEIAALTALINACEAIAVVKFGPRALERLRVDPMGSYMLDETGAAPTARAE